MFPKQMTTRSQKKGKSTPITPPVTAGKKPLVPTKVVMMGKGKTLSESIKE